MGQKLDKAARGAYDAIVYIDGSEVVAEDRNGRKIASGVAGTDDATVIQAAYDSFTSGDLYVGPGTYQMSSSLDVGKLGTNSFARTLRGAGPRATIFKNAANLTALIHNPLSSVIFYRVFRDFCVDGNKALYTGRGMSLFHPRYCLVHNVHVIDTSSYGIALRWPQKVNVALCYAERCQRGFYADGSSATPTYGLNISDCFSVSNADHGFCLGEYIEDTSLTNCYSTLNQAIGYYFETGGTGGGVRESRVALVNSKSESDNIGINIQYTSSPKVIGCEFVSATSHGMQFGSGGNNGVIDACSFRNNGGYGVSRTSGTGWSIVNSTFGGNVSGATSGIIGYVTLRNNIGLRTESSGSSTGTGSEQTIAHGLAAIPTGCKAWIRYPISATVYAEKEIRMDATNIYPKVKTGLVYDWRVE